MTDRIKELAKQCYKAGPLGKDGWPQYTTFDEVKFARLVVAECASLILNCDLEKAEDWGDTPEEGYNHPYFQGWNRGCIDSAVVIKQHFGVEDD